MEEARRIVRRVQVHPQRCSAEAVPRRIPWISVHGRPRRAVNSPFNGPLHRCGARLDLRIEHRAGPIPRRFVGTKDTNQGSISRRAGRLGSWCRWRPRRRSTGGDGGRANRGRTLHYTSHAHAKAMSESQGERWDRRYAEGDYRPRSLPSPFLEEWLEQLPVGRALDLACGTGRNAMRLAEAGYETDAIDVSQVAIERAKDQAADRGLAVNWQTADLDDVVLPESHYDLITVIRERSVSEGPPSVHRFARVMAAEGPFSLEGQMPRRSAAPRPRRLRSRRSA